MGVIKPQINNQKFLLFHMDYSHLFLQWAHSKNNNQNNEKLILCELPTSFNFVITEKSGQLAARTFSVILLVYLFVLIDFFHLLQQYVFIVYKKPRGIVEIALFILLGLNVQVKVFTVRKLRVLLVALASAKERKTRLKVKYVHRSLRSGLDKRKSSYKIYNR